MGFIRSIDKALYYKNQLYIHDTDKTKSTNSLIVNDFKINKVINMKPEAVIQYAIDRVIKEKEN